MYVTKAAVTKVLRHIAGSNHAKAFSTVALKASTKLLQMMVVST